MSLNKNTILKQDVTIKPYMVNFAMLPFIMQPQGIKQRFYSLKFKHLKWYICVHKNGINTLKFITYDQAGDTLAFLPPRLRSKRVMFQYR